MEETIESERRINLALDRIGRMIEVLGTAPAATPIPEATPAPGPDPEELAALYAALEDERATTARLTERVRAIRERQDDAVRKLEERIAAMTAQLDTQGLNMQRLRKINVNLRETIRTLREAASEGAVDPALVNRAMQAELDALRVSREAEIVEMDEILAELDPLLPVEAEDARG